MALVPAIVPISTLSMPVTTSAPSASASTCPPPATRSRRSFAGSGVTTRTWPVELRSDDLVDGALGDEAAAADDDEPIGGHGHLAHQVAGDEDGTTLGGERAQQLADPLDAFGVETVDRLVEQQRCRVAEQRGGDAEPLAHPEREPAGAAVGDVGEADEVEDLVDPPTVDVVRIGQPAQVVPSAASRMHRLGLEQGADVAEREAQVPVALPVDGDPTGGRPVEADHHAHGGGLAGAVGSEEAGDLSGLGPRS